MNIEIFITFFIDEMFFVQNLNLNKNTSNFSPHHAIDLAYVPSVREAAGRTVRGGQPHTKIIALMKTPMKISKRLGEFIANNCLMNFVLLLIPLHYRVETQCFICYLLNSFRLFKTQRSTGNSKLSIYTTQKTCWFWGSI